jgi:formate dehydrogenase major subunit
VVARRTIKSWPVLRQVTEGDPLGLGHSAQSDHSRNYRSRTSTAEKVVKSVCPYCAVGCGQLVYSNGPEIIQIEGDPDSPLSRGRLCPKGSATKELVNSELRELKVKYRRPHGTAWEQISLDQAMDMIADRVIETRSQTWEDQDEQGRPLRRTMGIASLGGATIDNEENYLWRKLMVGLGVVQVENQARI